MAKCNSCGNYVDQAGETCEKCYQSHGDGSVSKTNTLDNTIVSCEWLNQHLTDTNLVVLDASSKSNVSGLKSDLEDVQIPNTRYFDLAKDFSEPGAEFPNTFPSAEQFNASCQQLGINKDSVIVVYDNLGIFNSPRVWWMFLAMSHHNIYVLNGGLPAWVSKGFATELKTEKTYPKGDFEGVKVLPQIKDFQFMETYAPLGTVQVVDARSKGRFDGTAPEPREGLRSGSIPYSMNIPFQEVLENGFLKSKSQLEEIFHEVKANKRPKVFSCGSGLTACILLLAAKHIGIDDLSIYDGSWTEWATKTNES